jgi:hypothetical protein
MLTEWVIYEPAQENWPDLEWARVMDSPDYALALHRRLWPETTFKVREVTYQ